ncbi:MAG TPA: AI-2E family transporter [Candidatus Hydrogenedentes bacterium]|nr:AI-2E family transporter [Candidatus Hydrogenedentota bacterium]
MLKTVVENPWVRAGALAGALILVALITYLLSAVLVPLFFAFIVAYIFDPVIDALERRRVPRMLAVIVLIVILIVGFLSLPLILLPGLVSEAQSLIQTTAHDLGTQRFDRILNKLPLKTLVEQVGWAPPGNEEFNPRQVFAQHIGELIQQNAGKFIRSHVQDIAGAGKKAGESALAIFSSLGNSIMAVILFIGNFAVFAFVAVYLLKDYDRIIEAIHDLLPHKYQGRISDIMNQIDIQLRAYLRGQISVCACLGIMYMIGFALSGVPFAIPLGLLGGMASFIPYMGLALTALPAALLVLLEHGVDGHIIGLIITFLVAQGMEGYVITPKLVGSQVGLSPVWVVLAIMVFSTALGFAGLLLAVPIAAVLKVLLGEGLTLYRNSHFFQDPVSDGPES